MARQLRHPPTVVLVHGAFAGPSLWSLVVAQLREAGVAAHAVDNPLRRLAGDAAHVADRIRAIAGRVLLTGHAYGGAVITSAAAQADNAVGLVFVTGYALDFGESVTDIDQRFPSTTLAAALRHRPAPADHRSPELEVEPTAFAAVVAADVPVPVSARMAETQRPIALDCLTDRMDSAAAWHRLPSWYVVAADDRCLHASAQHFMAARAGARVTETAGSHAVAISQPTAVADTVLVAAHALT